MHRLQRLQCLLTLSPPPAACHPLIGTHAPPPRPPHPTTTPRPYHWLPLSARQQDGGLYLWGHDPHLNPWPARNSRGSGDDSPEPGAAPGPSTLTPRSAVLPLIHRVAWLGRHRFRCVALGVRHAVAVTTHDRLYYWGDEEALPVGLQYGGSR